MSLVDFYDGMNRPVQQGFATVTGQKGLGKVFVTTSTGAKLVLNGTLETGKSCFYDKRSRTILNEASGDVEVRVFGI